jgi:hypothetical protein
MLGHRPGWWGAGGSSRWAASLFALVLVAVTGPPSAASALPFRIALPTWTTSYYEQTANSAALYRQGEAAGKAGAEGIVILDFGRPAELGVTYGTMGFGGTFISLPAIIAGVESYISAYYRSAPGYRSLDVAVGTNNSCGTGQPCGRKVCGCSDEPASFYGFGAGWADAVEQLRSWSFVVRAEHAYTDVVRVVGADDAEPGYDPGYRNTFALLSGYAATVRGSEPAMVDYGSAEQSWSEAQLLQVAYGFAPDVPMPQVYYPSQASEWARLLAYAEATRHLRMTIFGVLAGGDPEAAYSEMLDAVARVTAQHTIPWLSTISA